MRTIFKKGNTMKTLIVSLLVVLSAGFAHADDEQDPPLVSVEEAQRLQQIGQRLNLGTSEEAPVYGPVLRDEERDDSWRESQQYRLQLECRQRRATEQSYQGDGLVDRAIGNRVRRNLEDNRRNATDDFDTFRRDDGSVGRVRIDPCAAYNPPEPREETDRRGCRFRINGNQKKLIAGSCRW